MDGGVKGQRGGQQPPDNTAEPRACQQLTVAARKTRSGPRFRRRDTAFPQWRSLPCSPARCISQSSYTHATVQMDAQYASEPPAHAARGPCWSPSLPLSLPRDPAISAAAPSIGINTAHDRRLAPDHHSRPFHLGPTQLSARGSGVTEPPGSQRRLEVQCPPRVRQTEGFFFQPCGCQVPLSVRLAEPAGLRSEERLG